MDEHSLQSPFLFEVYRKSLNPSRRNRIVNSKIEQLRRTLSTSVDEIAVNQFGSGSSMSTQKSKSIQSIAKQGISNRNLSEILVNLIEYGNYKKILELGTSLGLNTAYLSKSKGVDRVVSIDGNLELTKWAMKHFAALGANNISVRSEDIGEYLQQTDERFDMVFIDANHTYNATLEYFSHSLSLISKSGVIVLDDINWSKEMSKAWDDIRDKYPYHLYLENASIGIVFVNRMHEKNHYILRF